MEEENNNNERTIVDKGKEVVKNETKKAGAKILKKIIPAIAPAIGIFFLILLGLGLINLVQYAIRDIFSSILTVFSAENPEASSSATSESAIYIDDNGYYKLKVEDLSDQILKELEDQKVNTEVIGFDIEELEDMIEKYVKAEVQTTFPKTGRNGLFQNDVDGMITIKRASTSTGDNAQDLTYIDYDTFCSWVNSENLNVLNCFSLNPETFKLCIAKKGSVTEYYDCDGELIRSEGESIVKQEIDYQKYIQNYSVPLNFFVTLHLISEDSDFMQDVVDMIVGKGKTEPIVLTYVDSEQIYTTIYKYSGNYDKTIEYTYYDSESEQEEKNDTSSNNSSNILLDFANKKNWNSIINNNNIPIIEGDISKLEEEVHEEIDNNNVEKYVDETEDVKDFYKEVVMIYSGSLYITKADTWLKSSNKTVSEMEALPEDESLSEEKTIKDEKIGPETSLIVDLDEGKAVLKKKTETTYITETILSSFSSKKFTVVDNESEIIVDNFVELIKSYPNVKNNLETSPSNLFISLQQNENTQKLEKIMRYVIYKLNDIDYGVTEEDLNYLLVDAFISPGTIYGDTTEEKVWYTLRAAGFSEYATAGVMGNIWRESGFRSNNLENSFESILGFTDETYTEAIDNGSYTLQQFISDHTSENCGAGYGLCQWTYYTVKEGLYCFAKSRGVSIGDEDLQIEYLLGQLTPSGGADGFAKYSIWDRHGATVDEWLNAESPEAAAKAFCYTFEGIKTNTTPRENKAREYYEQFKGKLGGMFEQDSGAYITGFYTSTKGRRFTILNQGKIPGWSTKCNRAAAAIIASGYSDKTPIELVNDINTHYVNGHIIPTTDQYYGAYGLQRTEFSQGRYISVEKYTEILRNELESGGYVAIWLNKGGDDKAEAYYGQSGTKWTDDIHWVAVIDYRIQNGVEQIVIADGRGANWYNINEFIHGINGYAIISEQ